MLQLFSLPCVLPAAAATGSTTQFEIPPEDVEKFQSDHSQNGGSLSSNTTEDDDEDESLVYVTSPKVLTHHQSFSLATISADQHS